MQVFDTLEIIERKRFFSGKKVILVIRAILVDDEQLALKHLENKLNELGTVEVVKTFSNAPNVLKEMKHLDFQVAFLDIEMPGFNGLDLAELIQEGKKDVYIVFVTAYRDYAIQAFELHSIDYLLKPIMKERLEKTVMRLQEQLLLSDKSSVNERDTSPSLKIFCFDEFAVFSQEEPVKWKTAKVKELFAVFITHLNTSMNRDSLIDLLWPESEYQKAKIQLHTSISHLRKMLDSVGYPGSLTFSDQCYALELHGFQCDAIELERVLADYTDVDHDTIQVFEHVVQQYSGDYMDKNGYEWAAAKTQSMRQKLLQLLQKMIDYYSKNEELHKKQHYLQILLNYNPYSEHVLQQLMHYHLDVGNRGDAIKVYHDFKKQLLEDLDILPGRATNELYESILVIT